jgi:3-keto-5-aminohexanoate cleavage enzyme
MDAPTFPISFCPTGMVPRRGDSPHVPLTAEEISHQALEAAELGVTSVHLHARGTNEEPAWERSYYEDIIGRIRKDNSELVICVTTSGRFESDIDRRSDVLHLEGIHKPDLASLTLASMNFATHSSVNSPDTVKELAQRMLARGIVPELEVFDTGMVNYLKYLLSKGILEPPLIVNFILGGPASAQVGLSDLGLLVAHLPENSIWSAGGIGRAQLPANALALASGGGVRVGLEDNLYLDDSRTRHATNRELVQRVLEIGRLLGREPMEPSAFRSRYLVDSVRPSSHGVGGAQRS